MIRPLIASLALLLATFAHAASYPPHYRWRTITTEHFFVHFHQGEEEIAHRAAAIAEEVHARLTRRLNWTPRQRTHLILTDHVDVSNGSATTFPSNRMEVYVSAPGGDPSSPLEFYDNWLSLVIAHEYAHVLHLDQARAFPAFLRKVLGRHPAAFPNELSPLWMIEGLATLIESEETDAGRLKGTFVDMVLRTAAVENRWPTAAQASGLTAHWPGGSARYFYGSKFLEWIARKHGDQKLTRYFNEYSSNFLPYRINATARDVFGTTISRLYEEWSREQQQAYRDHHARLGTLTERTRVTSLGYETKHPALSPDGTRLAYAHRGPFEQATIRVRRIDGTRDEETLRVNTISPLSWSPDGTTIAFAQLEYRRSFALLSDIWLWSVGGDARRLTRGARLKDPAFAPDGKTLIAVQNEAGRNALVEVDVATGAIRPLVRPDDVTQFSEPNVSPDGTTIAVAEWRAGRIDIVLYARDGRRIRNLTESLPRSTNASPRFAGDAILFSSDVTGVPNLFLARDGELRRITNLSGGAFFPAARVMPGAASLGRTRVYFSDYHANGFDIAVFEATETYDVSPRALPTALARRIEDAAPEARAEATPYSPRTSVWPRWWSPIVTEDGAGFTIIGGDVLGFHNYTAQVIAGDRSSYGLAYSYDRWYPTFTLAAAQYEEDVVHLRQRDNTLTLYSQETRRLLAQVSAPWRQWQWQTVGYLAALRDDIGGPLPPNYSEEQLRSLGLFRGTLHGARAGVIFNNARTYGFSISPENGITARADYEHLGGDASVQQIRTDLRGFLAIPWRRSPLGRHVLAARAAAGRNSGDFIFQRELRVGGISEGEFIAAGSRDFPVRGYDTGTLRGREAALLSVEYRLPLFEIDRGPSTWPIFFHRIVADVFSDAGTATGRDGVRRTIASVGAEAAIDLVLGYWAPLRWRAGIAYRLRNPGRGDVQPFIALEGAF